MKPRINNDFYDGLGDRWYDDDGHAIAVLRAEADCKIRYVLEVFGRIGLPSRARVLDVGCGAGFVTIPLAGRGYSVKGVDLSSASLDAARRHLPAGVAAEFEQGDALALRDERGVFDAVLALDILEHVEHRERLLAEAARVLRPGGVFVFHTINRTLRARVMALWLMERFLAECPANLHVHHLFLKPQETRLALATAGLQPAEFRGITPKWWKRGFWRSIAARRVLDLEFDYTGSLAVGYLGYARSPSS